MTIDINLLLIYALPALIVGIILGALIFGSSGKRKKLAAELHERETELGAARERSDALERELAMARDQIAPLADEVDKLRAMKTRTAVPAPPAGGPEGTVDASPDVSAAAATAPPSSERGIAYQPTETLPTFLETRPDNPDDLSLLKGVGPKLETQLHDMGIWFFAQIADWSDADRRTVDAKLGNFKGRIERDQLQEQAKLLAAGRVTEYEARFGKLGRPGE